LPRTEPPGEPPSHDPLPTTGHDLPAEPLHRPDMPAGAKAHVGRLVTSTARNGRPVVGVLVRCPRCKRLHRYPWRWDWGLGLEVVSRQGARCPGKGAGKPIWVALGPGAAAENAAAHRAAHEKFVAWEAERSARKAARAESTPELTDPPPE
jgi:hypothetical protein